MLAAFEACKYIMYFMLCSRRLGKSWLLSSVAIRECLSKPNQRVLYLSKTTTQLREIVDQTIPPILDTCPESLKPDFKKMENKWVFKNGSEIRVVGLDRSGADSIRGVKAHLVIFDEVCFMEDIKNILNNAVMPMVIATGGRILFGSTPPSTPGHQSIDLIARCEEQDALIKIPIYDCPLYTPQQIQQFELEAGGKESTTFRREYLCEIITEADRAIFPAFNETKVKELVREPDPCEYQTDKYVSLDLGFRDLTVVLFGYWDYPRAQLTIQDELVFRQATTDKIAEAIKSKERELWRGEQPLMRVCDTDPRFVADIKRLNDLNIVATKKDNKEAQVNITNMLIQNNQLVIHPRCKTLISHMRYGLWNLQRTQFDRTEALGHCDAADALIYMVRNVRRYSSPTATKPRFNPYGSVTPMGWDYDDEPSRDLKNLKRAFRTRS